MIHNKIHDKITIMDTGLIEAINYMNILSKMYKKKEASSCQSFIYEEDLHFHTDFSCYACLSASSASCFKTDPSYTEWNYKPNTGLAFHCGKFI